MEPFECPVCGNTPLSDSTVGRVSMLQCKECHVTVTPQHLRRMNDERFYQDTYVMTPSSRASARQFHYSRYPEFVRLISEISTYCPPPGRWLDVGCGTGAFLEECRHAGYVVEGVELSKSSASEAERAGLSIRPTLQEVHDVADVVSMWHVLEHLDEPRTTLQLLRTLIRPDGVLCIRVPNFSGLWSRRLGERWVWFQPHQHTVHFGPENLRRLLQEAGFTVLMMRNQRPNGVFVRRAYALAASVFTRYAKTSSESATERVMRLLKDMTAEELFVVARLQA